MDVDELRARQGPLKEQYGADPESARVPLRATADHRDVGMTTTVDGWAGAVRAGLHPAAGGDQGDACSGDMLLEAVVACVGVTLRSVATAMRLDLSDVRIRADAFFDVRGTLGVDRSVPVGIQDLTVTVEVATDASPAALDRLAQLTERYCVVGQSLAQPPRISVTTFA